MLDRFWEGIGHGFSERLMARFSGPALLFWLGLLVAYSRHWLPQLTADHRLPAIFGVQPSFDPWILLSFLVIATVLLVVTSSALVEPLVLPTLQILEGYNLPYYGPRSWLIDQQKKRRRALSDRWHDLDAVDIHQLSASQRDEFAKLDLQLRLIPNDPALVMPSRLGNILRSAEHRPEARYGLSVMVCWPHLWLLLPDEARNELIESRERLDSIIRAFIFSVLFAFFGSPAVWPIFLGICAAILLYSMTWSPAELYGDLVFAVFTLYRDRLYRAVRWQVPSSPGAERAEGERLTKYLFRGTVSKNARFIDEPDFSGALQ